LAFFQGRWRRGAVWLVGLVALAFAVRAAVLAHFVDASVRVVRGVASSFPDRMGAEDDLDEPWPFFPLWPIDERDLELAESQARPIDPSDPPIPAPTPGTRVAKKAASVAVPPILPFPIDARASKRIVLSWAEKQLMPRGIHRPAYGDLPAGIELSDVASLGIGLLDGDRLLTVDGVPVAERAQVIGVVLGARSRRAETMRAGLVRRTSEGVRHFTVVVEQPYPEDVAAFSEGRLSGQMLPESGSPSEPQSAESESVAKKSTSD
jgi:hypothetical protein